MPRTAGAVNTTWGPRGRRACAVACSSLPGRRRRVYSVPLLQIGEKLLDALVDVLQALEEQLGVDGGVDPHPLEDALLGDDPQALGPLLGDLLPEPLRLRIRVAD